jgi:hypothetical protein
MLFKRKTIRLVEEIKVTNETVEKVPLIIL